MKKILFSLACCSFLVTPVLADGAAAKVGQVAQKETHESLCDEYIVLMQNVTKAMTQVTDKASAELAAKTIQDQIAPANALAKRLKALGQPNKQEIEVVNEKMDKADKAMSSSIVGVMKRLKKKKAVMGIFGASMDNLVENTQELDELFEQYYGAEQEADSEVLN